MILLCGILFLDFILVDKVLRLDEDGTKSEPKPIMQNLSNSDKVQEAKYQSEPKLKMSDFKPCINMPRKKKFFRKKLLSDFSQRIRKCSNYQQNLLQIIYQGNRAVWNYPDFMKSLVKNLLLHKC